jgi:hypothetical protein
VSLEVFCSRVLGIFPCGFSWIFFFFFFFFCGLLLECSFGLVCSLSS